MPRKEGEMFTPGPWVMERTDVSPSPYWEIAPMGDDGHPDWTREVACTAEDSEANACLICAAPDLYHALKRMVERVNECAVVINREGVTGAAYDVRIAWSDWTDAFNAAEAAIQKAEGR